MTWRFEKYEFMQDLSTVLLAVVMDRRSIGLGEDGPPQFSGLSVAASLPSGNL